MAKVKCPLCGESFNYDKESSYKLKTRWYHYDCFQKLPEETKEKGIFHEIIITEEEAKTKTDFENLKDCINKYFKDIDWSRVIVQIKRYMKDKDIQYSYAGIQKTIEYTFEVKKEKVNPKGGYLSFVKQNYKEAYEYYKKIFYIDEENGKKSIEKIDKEYTICIKRGRGIRNKILNWEEEDG